MIHALPIALLVGGLGSLGLGIYDTTKPKGGTTPNNGGGGGGQLPPAPNPNGGGGGLKSGIPPELEREVQQLLAYGTDPDAMDQTAAVLDTYGYTDLAAKLRARAAELRRSKGTTPPNPTPNPLPIPPLPVPPLPIPPVPTPTGQMALVTAPSGLNTRTSPSVSAPLVASNNAFLGTSVQVLNWDAAPADSAAPQGWAQIKTPGGSTGYASKQYLQLVGGGGGGLSLPIPPPIPPAPGPSPVPAATATVTAPSGLNTRTAPSASAPLVASNNAFLNTTVQVLNWNAAPPDSVAPQGWAQIVTPGGSTGYATKQYLRLNSTASTSGEDYSSTCLAPAGLALRTSPTPQSPFRGKLAYGEKAVVIRSLPGAKASAASPSKGGWSLIRTSDAVGWVPSEWLL